MKIERRVFTREFKVAAVEELKSGKSAGVIARQLEINPNMLHRWRRELKNQPARAFSGQGKRVLAESREAELERKIGQQTMEIDFLKELLVRFEEQRTIANGGTLSTRKSVKKTNR